MMIEDDDDDDDDITFEKRKPREECFTRGRCPGSKLDPGHLPRVKHSSRDLRFSNVIS